MAKHKPPEPAPLEDTQSLLAKLEAERQQRAAACQAAIGAALQQFGCDLVPEVIISGERVMSRVSIIPK